MMKQFLKVLPIKSTERALEIVEAAAKAGVSALKTQTYTAGTMTLDRENFLLMIPRAFGMENPCINCVNKPIPLGSGMNQS